MLPFDAPLSGAFGLLFTMLAHALGWPVVEGGSARIVDALAAELESLDGRIITGQWVRSLHDLPPARATLLDVTPRQLIDLAGDRLPGRYRRGLEHFRYGPGICKVDWALDGPVPWQAEHCREAVTLHVGGTFAEVARSEADVAAGRHPERPFCLVTQPCVVDPTRAPAGKHTLWAYCHVPNGSNVDMTERIEAQIERFAPGLPRPHPGPGHHHRRARPKRTTRATWAATSAPERPRLRADRLPAHRAVEPLPHRDQGRLPLLGLHPARRWRPRHVRCTGRPAPRCTISAGRSHRVSGVDAESAVTVNDQASAFAWYRFRATFGHRWGGLLAVVLLTGLLGGLSMGAIEAARTTESSPARLRRQHRHPGPLRPRRLLQPGHRAESGYNPSPPAQDRPPPPRGEGRVRGGDQRRPGREERRAAPRSRGHRRQRQRRRAGFQRGPGRRHPGQAGQPEEGRRVRAGLGDGARSSGSTWARR